MEGRLGKMMGGRLGKIMGGEVRLGKMMGLDWER